MREYFDKALEQFKIDFQDRNLIIFYDELATNETLYENLEEAYAKSSLSKIYPLATEDDLKTLFCEKELYNLALECISRRNTLWGDEYEPIIYWLKKGLKNILSKHEEAKDIFNSINAAKAFARIYCRQENNLPLMIVSPLRSKIFKSNLLPLRECPECHKTTLATYSVKRGLGIHSIKAVCLNQECIHATFMETNRELLRYCMAYLENASSNISDSD